MSERNRLQNGRFLHNLNNWTVSGAEYSAGDGDDHYGVAVLSTGGDYISQTFSVNRLRSYSLSVSVKGLLSGSQATIAIKDGDGNAVVALDLSGADGGWTDNLFSVGLAPATTYTITITNTSAAGDIKLDDIWLWFVPITRTQIAAKVADRLGSLATDAGLSATASGSKTEGDYTYAIDSGLRSVGAVNPETGLPDTRYLDTNDVGSVIDAVEAEMISKLQNEYAIKTDLTVGPRRESLSQISINLSKRASGSGGSGSGSVYERKMKYGD